MEFTQSPYSSPTSPRNSSAAARRGLWRLTIFSSAEVLHLPPPLRSTSASASLRALHRFVGEAGVVGAFRALPEVALLAHDDHPRSRPSAELLALRVAVEL